MTARELLVGLSTLESVASLIGGDVGRYGSVALLLAQDFVRAGKSAEELDTLRQSIRDDWQTALDSKFPG